MSQNLPSTAEQVAPAEILRSQLEKRVAEFRMALPAHISPEKFQRTIMTAVQQSPDLLNADRRSLILACMKAAQDGLLPDGREAALVTFKVNKKDAQGRWESHLQVQYMPMVYGLRKKILQSGEIADIQTSVVYAQEIEAGLFIYEEGTERTLRHKPLLDPRFEPKDEDIAAAYSIATFKDGSKSFEVMRRSEINKVRQCSQTGAVGKTTRDGKPIPPKGPWVDWFSEQSRKTVMRRHSKTLPMSGDIIDVEAIDDALAARSATALMSHEPEAPALPARPTRGDVPEIDHDPDTGEIIDVADSANREMDAEYAGIMGDPEPEAASQARVDPKQKAEPEKKAPKAKATEKARPTMPEPLDPHCSDEAVKVYVHEMTGYIRNATSRDQLDDLLLLHEDSMLMVKERSPKDFGHINMLYQNRAADFS